jgi:hypothetical protein
MQPKWRINDLIDLEYFLHQDAGSDSQAGETENRMRDRRIFLDFAKTHSEPFSRRELLRFWVEEKKKSLMHRSGSAASPGDVFAETYGIIRLILILASLVFGGLLSVSLLSYTGAQPINIFTCLWVLIAPQLLLLVMLAVSLIPKSAGNGFSFSGGYPLLSALIRKRFLRMVFQGTTAVGAEKRNAVREITGLIGRQKTLYGSIFFWPVFILAQLFGLFYNIGLLCALMAKITLTDLAFGWQSTLQPGPETVYRIVHAISAPWAWFAPPPTGHPTLEQIEGTQLVLKEGMAHLATADLVSWWPFLFLAILFYGLIPRLLLIAVGAQRLSTALRRIDFSHGACDSLIHRMRTPLVETGNRAFFSDPSRSRPASKTKNDVSDATDSAARATEYAVVLVPKEIDNELANDLLAERIAQALGLRMLHRAAFSGDPKKDAEGLLKILSKTQTPLSQVRILVLQEAWQPPIRETLFWIEKLRKAAGKNTGIIIGLVGKPRRGLPLTAPDDTHQVIWRQAVNSLGDPFLRTAALEG